VTCHDLIPLHYPLQYFALVDGYEWGGRRLLRRRYRSADHVVAISEATRSDVVRLLGLAPSKVSRVYCGVSLESWSPRAQADDPERLARYALGATPYLLYVGDTDWRKNAEGMLGGLKRARAAGAPTVLAFAGRHRELWRRRVAQLTRGYGVAAAVRLLGYVPDADLAALYRHATALLFVSRIEGFGLPVVEAMACGCPVITTRGGSLAEIAADGACVVDPEDHRAIAEAILGLTDDPSRRRELARRGIDRAADFSVQAQARAMVKLYRRLVDQSPRKPA
jgi:glycosyltransferase involved in cell wall biosynthesis